jgi:hypothetical protein
MINTLKQSLWKQFAASIDMLDNAITAWPDDHWGNNKRFFYIAYHSLVFLDYYLSIPPVNFVAILPYTLTGHGNIPEDGVDDIMPNKLYSKQELLDYLQGSREKCRLFIASLTDEKLNEYWINGSGKMDIDLSSINALQFTVFEILIYNMRHVQHHAAQLNLILRQTTNDAPNYVTMAKDKL